MTIKVQGPDGQQIEFPEGTDAGVIKSVMQKRYGAPAAAAPSPVAAPAPAAPEPPLGGNTVDDMGTFERLRAGYGKFGVDLAQGVKQLGAMAVDQIPFVDLSDYRQGLRDEVAEQRRLDSNLMDTTAGTAGNILGGLVTLAPLGAAGLAAKGAGALRAIGQAGAVGAAEGAVMPVAGTDDSERLGNMGVGAALGGGLSALGRGVMRVGEELLPSNLTARAVNFFGAKANNTPFAQEGEALAARTGIQMTPAQISGSKAQTAAENIARQSVFSSDKAFEADTKVANQTLGYVNRVMDRISRDSLSGEGVGENVQRAVREGVEKVRASREATAAQQFGELRRMVGDAPVVEYGRTQEVLKKIMADYGDVPGEDAMQLRNQAARMLDEVTAQPGFSLDSARRARSFYGSAAAGSANIFKDISPGLNARIAKMLYGAMSDDIAAAGTKLDELAGFNGSGMVRGGVTATKPSELLQRANDDYRRHSQLLEAMELSPLRRLIGDEINVEDFMRVNSLPPETVVTRLNAMKPTEIKMVRNFMEQSAPDTWQQYKRLIVEDALTKARTAPASAGANTLPLNAGAFIRALGGDKPDKLDQLRAIFKPEEMAEITDALQATRRLGDKFGANFSGTGVYNEVMSAVRDTTVKGLASTASAATGFNKIAKAMMNADGRRALIELSRLPPNSKRANDFAAMLVSIMGATSAARQPLPQDQRMASPVPASATPGTQPPGS